MSDDIFDLGHARARDAVCPLRSFRDEFLIPRHGDREQAYFAGNSLGLQPKGARAHVEEVLDKWAHEAVEGHFTGQAQWMPYHELVRDPLARVVGAQPSEVVAMNSLTANLHLMLVSFYQPTIERTAILVEAGSFPSDRYAVESQLKYRGLPPQHTLIEVEPDQPDGTFSMQAIERAINENGKRLALVLWPGVQYRTGQAAADDGEFALVSGHRATPARCERSAGHRRGCCTAAPARCGSRRVRASRPTPRAWQGSRTGRVRARDRR